MKDVNNWYSAGMTIVKFNKNGNYVWGCPIKREQINSSRSFLGSFTLNDFTEPYYFYNALSNLDLKKGIPPNYGQIIIVELTILLLMILEYILLKNFLFPFQIPRSGHSIQIN
ncbi:MAG: hypothetical protein CM15mP65_23620 [Crocinitomicaceae bacterium]|nr:MAG: hypothetical protein CM15mP65_23620 [Crocinitomicaceae bacterium]